MGEVNATKLRSTLRFAGILLLSLLAGCSSTAIAPRVGLLDGGEAVYTDDDWASVLRTYVHDGLVNYDGLAQDRDALDRYYALLSRTGPTLTPEQFQTRAQKVAYWINAHNALVLQAVLRRYPVATMYDLTLPQLHYEYTFRVDGASATLAGIQRRVLEESGGDVRTLFTLHGAAMGTPRLSDQPYRADTLDHQLAQAAAAAMENSDLLRIDHTTKSILLWQQILRHEDDFVAWWKEQRRLPTVFLYNVLLELASPAQRRALQAAVGYTIREIPFERELNRWNPPATQVAFP
jgi:hypothetical protein